MDHRTRGLDRDKTGRIAATICALFAAMLMAGGVGLLALSSASATTGNDSDQVCSGLDSGKIDVSGDKLSVTVTAPEGKLISGYCVKAGSTATGDGPHYVTLEAPQKTVTLTYTASDGKAKALSHYSLSYVTAPSGGGGSEDEVVVATVQFHNPTCTDKTASWQGFVDGTADGPGDGVTFAVTGGTVAPGQSVTITATAESGHEFAGGLTTMTFTHTFTAVPTDCGEGEATVVVATVTFHNPTCADKTASWQGFVDGTADGPGDGVTFAVTGTVAPGQSVTITATAESGHEFAGGLTTMTFTHTFGAVPTDCQVVSPPGGGGVQGGGAGPTGGGGVAVAPGAATTGSSAGTVPTVVEAGLPGAPDGTQAEAAIRAELGRGMVAAGLLLLCAAGLLGTRRSGGAQRA